MLTERNALVMLDGVVPDAARDPHLTRAFYQSIQRFATASLAMCENGNVKKFEEHLKVALRLFREGNVTVKNGVINVYLFTLAYALDKQAHLITLVEKVFPKELREEYHRLHYISGI